MILNDCDYNVNPGPSAGGDRSLWGTLKKLIFRYGLEEGTAADSWCARRGQCQRQLMSTDSLYLTSFD